MDNFWNVIAVAVIVVLLGMGFIGWGIDIQQDGTATDICQRPGFDGQVEMDGEWFCYVACPLDLAIEGECSP